MAGDERLVVPEVEGPYGERIYMCELAEYLGRSLVRVKAFARQHKLMHRTKGRVGWRGVDYVTPYGAMRIIGYMRALDGAEFMTGRDPILRRARLAASERRQALRKKALAIPRA